MLIGPKLYRGATVTSINSGLIASLNKGQTKVDGTVATSELKEKYHGCND
jgi:hypothetical protein